jgi:hypothetical protein
MLRMGMNMKTGEVTEITEVNDDGEELLKVGIAQRTCIDCADAVHLYGRGVEARENGYDPESVALWLLQARPELAMDILAQVVEYLLHLESVVASNSYFEEEVKK